MVPVSRPYYSKTEIDKIIEKTRLVLTSGRLVNGSYLQEFEKKFSEYIGCKESVGLNSGTAALEIALRCINVDGREVITTTNTCTSVINSIIFAGGIPVLADIKKETLALDPEKLRKQINNKTKAVIIVHIAGNIQKDIEDIQNICKTSGIILIEDSCRALGAKKDGKLAGNFGDISCFSFYAAKQLSTGNGGMLTTNDTSISQKAKILREHGRNKKASGGYEYKEIGHNMILDEFGAILGLSQLSLIENFITERTKIANFYNDIISDINYLERAIEFDKQQGYRNSYYRYPILVSNDVDPAHFEEHMNRNGVQLGHYYPMIHETNVYGNKTGLIQCDEMEIASSISSRLFSLPIFNSMTSNQVDEVIQSLVDYR